MSELNNSTLLLAMPDGITLCFECTTFVQVEKIDGHWTVVGVDDEGWDMDDVITSAQLAAQNRLSQLEKLD